MTAVTADLASEKEALRAGKAAMGSTSGAAGGIMAEQVKRCPERPVNTSTMVPATAARIATQVF